MRIATKKKLICIRYIFPPALMLAIPLFMLIPSYRYVTSGELRESISAWSLLWDSFADSRQILFDGGDHSVADVAFSKTALGLSVALSVLYVIALAAAIYCTAVAMKYFFGKDDRSAEKSRTLFITFFPNRICISAAELLCLPLMLMPYFMPYLFKSAYKMNVSLVFSAPDALMICGVLLLGVFVLSALCAPMERALGIDMFKKNRSEEIEDEEYSQNDVDTSAQKDEDELAKEERNRRIRELLGQKNDE